MGTKAENRPLLVTGDVKKAPSLTSLEGASLLIGLQVGSRALTFIVNQVLLRYLSPELFGISTQLELYSITVLFFARESLRVAIQRQADTSEDDDADDGQNVPEGYVAGKSAAGKTQAIVNLAYISINLGTVFAVILAWLYMRTLSFRDPSILDTPYFQESLRLFGLAAFWELLSEPCFVVVQQKSRFKIRAAAESVATLFRCLLTCCSAVWAARSRRDIGILPFALGQGMYAITLVLIYYSRTWSIASKGGFSLMPKPIYSRDKTAYFASYLSRPLLRLGGSVFAQAIVKHVLTQGDTILIASLASQRAQGVYALANNYGGLVARLIFQPVEESSRNYFGKTLSSVGETSSKVNLLKAKRNFLSLLRAYILLSVCILAAGPTIAPLLLKIVVGSRWTDSGAGRVLGTYCYYIPLLAINGLTEAFVSSVATNSEVNRQSLWMLAFSAGFAGAAILFLSVLQLGAEGLVWANVLNMFFRIIWSTVFIKSYLKRHGTGLDIGSLMPRPMTIAAGVGTYAVLAQMAMYFKGDVTDIFGSGLVALGFVIVVAFSERNYLSDLYLSIRGDSK